MSNGWVFLLCFGASFVSFIAGVIIRGWMSPNVQISDTRELIEHKRLVALAMKQGKEVFWLDDIAGCHKSMRVLYHVPDDMAVVLEGEGGRPVTVRYDRIRGLSLAKRGDRERV